MVEIVPAILAKDFSEIRHKLAQVEQFVNWVQIDVSDGNFTPNVTWNNPHDIKYLDTQVRLEIHLMISQPTEYLDQWMKTGAKRLTVHLEAVKRPSDIEDMIAKCHRAGVEFGLALNPHTPAQAIFNFADKVDLILFLAVSPGFGGRKFRPAALTKIKFLRRVYPDVNIGVDGGINPDTAKRCVAAGADILVAGNYIFGSDDIPAAIRKLKLI